MRVVIISEKRLGELFELAAGRISSAAIDRRMTDPVVLKTTVLANLDQLKAAIRDGEL